MKPTFLLLVALAITPPLMAVEKGKKAHSPKKTTEVKAESDAIDFKVIGAGGTVKTYHLEVPQEAGKAQDLGFKLSEQAAVEWKTTHKNGKPLPFPYYLVNMTGKAGNASQPLYAVVLENGELVRPIETTSMATTPEKPAARSKKSKA